MIIEYSSMCLNEYNYKEKILEAKNFVEKNGFEFGIQLHNSIDKNLFYRLLEFKGQIKFSIHSPIFSKYFINLASNDYDFYKNIILENIKYLDLFESKVLFFHGLFMTEKKILHDMKNYRKTMADSISSKFCLNNSFIMNPEYFNTEEYLNYKNTFIKNYDKVKKDFSDYIVAIENDFVGIGSGLQRFEEIVELIDNLWFDLGHFWCASLVHNFDFYEESLKIIEKKNIIGVHINHNIMSKEDKKEDIKDSHSHLYIKTSQDLKPIVRKLYEKGINIFTLEILDGDIEDIKILIDWLG